MEAAASKEERVERASVLMTRAAVFRQRSIKYVRLRSRQPVARNQTEALVLVAGAIADLEDSVRAIVCPLLGVPFVANAP
jgi:hypothetical protein